MAHIDITTQTASIEHYCLHMCLAEQRQGWNTSKKRTSQANTQTDDIVTPHSRSARVHGLLALLLETIIEKKHCKKQCRYPNKQRTRRLSNHHPAVAWGFTLDKNMWWLLSCSIASSCHGNLWS